MPARVSRAASWLIAACLVLGGCAELPQQPQLPQQPAVPAKPDLLASMARHHTADPDEIRRRWGDYALLMGETFVGTSKNPVEINEFKWQVWGALARVDFLSCYESTRKCDEGWFRVQYEPEHRRLRFLNSNDHPWAHATVQPDGSVNATNTAGGNFTMRFDYDRDEGVLTFPQATSRYVPTERKQFTEIRKQWKEVDAQTRGDERAAAQAAAQALEAQRRADKRREDAEFAQNFNRALGAFSQSYNSSMQDYRRQQAQSYDRSARTVESPRPASAPAQRRELPRTTPEALRAPPPRVEPEPVRAAAASQPARPNRSQQEQAQAPAAQPQAAAQAQRNAPQQTRQPSVSTKPSSSSKSNSPASDNATRTAAADDWAARRAENGKPKSEQVATASRGQARAWCMREKSGNFLCNGPLQNGGWGKTLERALEMSGCAGGVGYTPTFGHGGKSFNCGRELKSYEKAVPTYDPFYKRDKAF